MLGDQSALRERRRQHRLVAHEPHVGVKRHDQADAGAGPFIAAITGFGVRMK